MENIDIKQYENNEEKIKTIKESTNNFNWLDFYNSGEDINALIVITPEQKLILTPIYRPAYALSLVYDLLYGIKLEDDTNFKEDTNNIFIRLVTGDSMSIYTVFPKEINLYQDEEIIKLIRSLQQSINQIKYPDQFTEVIFKETYEDCINKLKEVKVVDELDKEVIPDKYNIENYSKVNSK